MSPDLYGGLLLEVEWRVFRREVWLWVGARWRLIEARLGRRQRIHAVNGPWMLVSEKSSSVTVVIVESQQTPFQLQGVVSVGFHEERDESGSSKVSLNWYRYNPSWFKPDMFVGRDNIDRRMQNINNGLFFSSIVKCEWLCPVFESFIVFSIYLSQRERKRETVFQQMDFSPPPFLWPPREGDILIIE